MKQLYFVRHGESELNRQRTYAGRLDTPLTDHGREQAQLAGAQAANLHFDLIVSSPLIRAFETAQIIAAAVGYPPEQIRTNPGFMERSLGSLEGLSWDEIGENDDSAVDIESEAALIKRAQDGLAYLRELEAETLLLVGHGSFAKALYAALDPSRSFDKIPEPSNAKLVQLI